MFDSKNGRNRYRKPVMYDLAADSEWGVLSPRPLARWTKRRPTRRALVLFACLFMAAVYGVRVWNARQHVHTETGEPTHGHKLPPQHEEPPPPPPEWDQLPKPPLFERYHEAEMALPQHHVNDPFAGGKKYLWVENHVHGEYYRSVFRAFVMRNVLPENRLYFVS